MLRVTIAAVGIYVLQGANAAERPLSPESYYFEARRANELFERKQYEQALPLIQNLTDYYGDDSSVWIEAAIAANETGRLELSLEAARRAVQVGAMNERYNCFEIAKLYAKLYAKLGQQDHALESLERALETRYTPRTRIRDEPAFRALYTNVGESTGWIELPYSGTRVMISERHHQHAALPDDARNWIAPHLPVELTARDYFSNRDPVMDAVLRILPPT